jgi:transglutaminase-like putative cysteine protease
MLFDIVHRTDYRYGQPATEAVVEARLTPPQAPWQETHSHKIEFAPEARASNYTDHLGNVVTAASVAIRHQRFSVVNRLRVRTAPRTPTPEALEISVAEARQIFSSQLADVFDFLQPTSAVPTGGLARPWAERFFPGRALLGEALEKLCHEIYRRFGYEPGSTNNATPLTRVWKARKGVCQDFAHVMLSVLRTAGIPARYVCGYIETVPPGGRLVGAVATHAWVEALLPGRAWAALDPTNRCWCGEQHISMAYGRDFDEAAPVRGTFKGSGHQTMKVKVLMKRLRERQ